MCERKKSLPHKLKRMLTNRITQNASWLVLSKIIQMLINLVVGILTARYLGPGNYGLINYGAAYTAFFTSLATLGINSVIVKEFVDNRNEEGKIIGTALGLRAIASLLSTATIVAVSSIIDANDPTARIVVFLCSLGLVFGIFDTFNYWFQSRLESKKTAIASLIAFSTAALYKAILLITGQPVEYFALAISLDHICLAVVLFLFYKKANGGKFNFSLGYAKNILQKSYHFILPGLMVAIYAQTDKIMLKHMIGDAEIGYYATAISVCNIWCFVLSAIIDSLTPPIMEAYNSDRARFKKLNKVLYAIVFYISIIVSLVFTLFGEFLIDILYGEAYLPTVAPLRVITWYTAFSYLGVARNPWAVCESKQKYFKYIYLTAAVANLVLNVIFIPIWGAVGAAFASLIAQITTIVFPLFIKGMRGNTLMMFDAIMLRLEIRNKKN